MSSFDTQHQDVLHDTQYNYYGNLLATCSSDRTIKIFSVPSRNDGQQQPALLATLTGHEGPVWMVAWAHPRFGNTIASCSYDTKAIVWRQQQTQQSQQGSKWVPVHIVSAHDSSVNAVAWAPEQYGAVLATASSDGSVGITMCDASGAWHETVKIGENAVAHPMGAMAAHFMPFLGTSSTEAPPLVLASAGCDGYVRVWALDQGVWRSVAGVHEHTDWVRDVAFSPVFDGQHVLLASCAQDRRVVVRRIPVSELAGSASATTMGKWTTAVTELPTGVNRLSWSPCGSMLIATTSESEAYLLRPGGDHTAPWVATIIDQQQQ